MIRHRPPPPIEERVDARRPISADLLAASASTPLALAGDFGTAWFDAAEELAERDVVLVFDAVVVGRPDPLLLEAAHQIRLVRRAEHLGLLDDEEADWYEAQADGDDAFFTPPTIPERALLALADGQESERLALGSHVVRRLTRTTWSPRDDVMHHVLLELALQRLLAELAEAVRIGLAVVVDAGPAGARRGGFLWAA